MDADRFDDVIRSLAASPSRRRVLGLTLGGGFGALLGVAEAAAKKRKGKRKNKNNKKKRKCLVGQRRCRDRRCHGCCTNDDCGGNPCEAGTCRDCPRGERLCRGGCILEDSCCTDSDCTAGRACLDGACACGPNQRLCEGFCIPGDACCTSDDCDGAPCEQGRCLCAEGQRDCHGRCIPDNACCSSSDCGPCETCQNDRCLSVCPEDLECVGGQCRCTATSCDGCCAGDTCRDGDTSNFCGRGGEICTACPAAQSCQGGVCRCPSGEKPCGEACIPEDDCCTDADCTPPFLCAEGTCTATCPAGADGCGPTDVPCGSAGSNCSCVQTAAGETRCGSNSPIPGQSCNQCETDSQCEEGYPNIPGVFCATVITDGRCLCPQAGMKFCAAPCPA